MLRKAVIVIAIIFIAGGCSSGQTKRGVGVRQVDTNVGLGVEAPLNAAPPNIAISKPIKHEVLELPPIATFPPFVTPAPVHTDCPTAGDFDFPEVEAGTAPDEHVRPAPGEYKYHLDGTVVTDQGKEKVSRFESRILSKVVDDTVAPAAFDYTMSQTQLIDDRQESGTLETTYRVVPTGRIQSTPNAPVIPRTSDTGRGVYLVSIVFKSTDPETGKPVQSQFQPTSPLELLAYPVVQGADINASGTDPETGTSLSIVGTVKSKKQVDACGKRIDSWLIDANETYRYTNSSNLQTQTIEANYDYGISPQFGSMITFEHVDAPKEGPIIQLDARVGAVPKPQRVKT